MSDLAMDDEEDQESTGANIFPQPGDVPFVDGNPWWLNACFGYTQPTVMPYIEGYQTAARVLLEHVRNGERDQDVILFPLVFLWRHCLELQLKDLIDMGQQLSGKGAGRRHHHRLSELWAEVRAIIVREEPGQKPTCDVVDGIIKQLSEVDPGSDGFRYPHDKSGNPTLNGLPERVNLGHLNKVMERVVLFLRCGAYDLSSRLECKLEAEREAEAEARRCYEAEVGRWDE